MAEVSPSGASQFSSRRMGELRTAAAAKMTNAAASAPPLPAPDVTPPPPSSEEPTRRTDSIPTVIPSPDEESTMTPVDPQEERRRKRADQVEQTRNSIVNARDSFIKRNRINLPDSDQTPEMTQPPPDDRSILRYVPQQTPDGQTIMIPLYGRPRDVWGRDPQPWEAELLKVGVAIEDFQVLHEAQLQLGRPFEPGEWHILEGTTKHQGGPKAIRDFLQVQGLNYDKLTQDMRWRHDNRNDPPYPKSEQIQKQFDNTGTPLPTDQQPTEPTQPGSLKTTANAIGTVGTMATLGGLAGYEATGTTSGALLGSALTMGGAMIASGADLVRNLRSNQTPEAPQPPDTGAPMPEAGAVPPTRVDKTTSPSRRRFWPLGGSKPDAAQAALDADIARMRTPDRTSNPGSAPIDIAPSALLTPPTSPAEPSVPTLPTAPPVVPPEQRRSILDRILRRNRASAVPAEPVTLSVSQADQDDVTGAGAPPTTRPEDMHLYQPPRTNVDLGVPEPGPIIDPASTSTRGEEV